MDSSFYFSPASGSGDETVGPSENKSGSVQGNYSISLIHMKFVINFETVINAFLLEKSTVFFYLMLFKALTKYLICIIMIKYLK